MSSSAFEVMICPSISNDLRHGDEVPYGWSVSVGRWLSDWGGTRPYGRVSGLPADTREPSEGYLVADLDEFEGCTTEEPKLRNLFAGKRVPFRCTQSITGWNPRWYESACVEVMAPFQNALSRDPDRTYRLNVVAFLSTGEPIGEDSILFANLPTYCLWDVELDRSGGIEKVIDGRRILAGVRSSILPADFRGEGRAGLLHVVGTYHLAAYDATGEKLWSRSDAAGVGVYNSVATRAFDINADGRDEVITMWGKPPEARILILEGTTGEVLHQAPWPGNDEDLNRWHHGGNAGHVAYAYDAKVYVANFRGLGQARDIVLQTGDENRPLYSILTDELEPLWEFDLRQQREKDAGGGAHCPVMYDIDGDGCDEMLAGTYMLDEDGTLLWMLPFDPTFFDDSGDDHIDGAEIGPVGARESPVVAFANNCVVADALSGDVLWHGESDHGQNTYIRKVCHDLPGNQIIFADKLGPKRLYDADGRELEWPVGIAGELGDWDGDGRNDETIGAVVKDANGRVIGIGTPGKSGLASPAIPTAGEPCPLVKHGVLGSITAGIVLGLNGSRARAFSGIPIPPPGQGKLHFPPHIYNHMD